MAQSHYIVYSTATGAILRHGNCPLAHVASQARAAKGEALKLDQPRTRDEARALMVEQRLIQPASGLAYLRRRPAAEIEARTPKPMAQPTSPDVRRLLQVLRQKHGLDITPAELAQADPPALR